MLSAGISGYGLQVVSDRRDGLRVTGSSEFVSHHHRL